VPKALQGVPDKICNLKRWRLKMDKDKMAREFAMMVETDMKDEEMRDWLAEKLGGKKMEYGNRMQHNGNRIEVKENDQADSKRIDEKEGWLYYSLKIFVEPFEDMKNLERQAKLAKELKALFEKNNMKAVVLADFESMLEE
jgi:hypothetical protein